MGEETRPARSFREYLAAQTPDVQREVVEAGEVLDVALLLRRARVRRSMTQAQAAEAAQMQQQAISRFEQVKANIGIETLGTYLNALGYEVDLNIREPKTGTIVGTLPIGVQHEQSNHERTRGMRPAKGTMRRLGRASARGE